MRLVLGAAEDQVEMAMELILRFDYRAARSLGYSAFDDGALRAISGADIWSCCGRRSAGSRRRFEDRFKIYPNREGRDGRIRLELWRFAPS